MTEPNELQNIRTSAKRYARAKRIKQVEALDLVAVELGFPNWVKLIAANKNGWRPSSEQTASIEAYVADTLPPPVFLEGNAEAMTRQSAYFADAEEGSIGRHAYRLQEILGDVIIAGAGWSITVPENPRAVPTVRTYVAPEEDCPVRDPAFLQSALTIAQIRADQVRGAISTDWSRRSTLPDIHGVVRHPLGEAESDVWFCFHCDAKITGAQIAENIWHCPRCGASPIEIFETAFWADDGGKSFSAIETSMDAETAPADLPIADGRPQLDLDEEKITLLMRSALIEDATNVSERLAALMADISVDEDNDVWIALEVDLWPEDKDAAHTSALASVLGVEVEFMSSWSKIPFAWPGLGEFTTSTSEYAQMMLDAYAENGVVAKRKPKDGSPTAPSFHPKDS